MTYYGRVQNGVVVFDDSAVPPEGIEVRVEAIVPPGPRTLADRFQGLIGSVTDLPSDMAEQHDHYIHGTPRA